MARIVRRADANECRRCTTFCDRVIAPSVRLAGYPTTRCSFEVERAREDAGERCVNPSFFDWPDAGRDGIRAFDLRDRCE